MNPRELRRRGVLGINSRNVGYTLRCNARRNLPLVDDKLATRRLCEAAGIAMPAVIAVARTHREARQLPARLREQETFVVKPARGAMGNGILILDQRDGVFYRRGVRLGDAALTYHAASIVSGLYSLAGHADVAVVEERLVCHDVFKALVPDGVPDIRVIVYRGIPVMAMTRLPTVVSGGRANLHQGAIGVGVDLATGMTTHATFRNRPIRRHPDSDAILRDVALPHFDRILSVAVGATDQTGLGYVGADVVVDEARGPVILELNGRPGLAVQMANRAGLLPRLRAVDTALADGELAERTERIALGREIAWTHAT